MHLTRTTSDLHKSGESRGSLGYRGRNNKRMSHPSVVGHEEPSFDYIFDKFRNMPGVDMLWVKEQVYGTPCIPESCPDTRSIKEVCGSLRSSLSGSSGVEVGVELEEGEVVMVRENKRRN